MCICLIIRVKGVRIVCVTGGDLLVLLNGTSEGDDGRMGAVRVLSGWHNGSPVLPNGFQGVEWWGKGIGSVSLVF